MSDVKLPELQGPTESIMQALQRNHSELLAALRESAADKQRSAIVEGERDRQYEFNAEAIVKIAALEQMIAELEKENAGLNASLDHTFTYPPFHDEPYPKNADEMTVEELARVGEYSETCQCSCCRWWGYMLKMRQRAERAESELAIARDLIERHKQEER